MGPRKESSMADHAFGIFNIELTNRCPMRCVMCPRTKSMTRPQGFMDFELYTKAIDELISVNPGFAGTQILWLHHFGESLLHPRFDLFIRYANSKEIRTGLSINPWMLTNPVSEKLIRSEPHTLYISLDGHDDESFMKIRGMENAYTVSHERLIRFLNLKKEMKSETTVILSMIDFHRNSQSIDARRKYWESMEGIDSFLPKTFITWDGSCREINELTEGGNRYHEPKKSPTVTCTFPFERMTVTWDGTVVPCCFDFNNKYVCGDLNKQSLREIWTGERMVSLRREFRENRVTNPLCSNCEKLHENI